MPTSSPANCSPLPSRRATAGRSPASSRRKRNSCARLPGRLVGETKDTQRQPRLLPDALDSRAAHPPREGDLQHLHQPGADRADGDGLHDRLRQAGPARTGRAESGQGALPRRRARRSVSPDRSSTSSSSARTAPGPRRSIRRCSSRRSSAACRSNAGIPSLPAAMLLCATEMNRRADMDAVEAGFSHDQEDPIRISPRTSRCCSRSALRARAAISLPQLDVPAVDPAAALGAGQRAQRDRGLSRSERSGGDPPLHAPLHLELRHRSRAFIRSAPAP